MFQGRHLLLALGHNGHKYHLGLQGQDLLQVGFLPRAHLGNGLHLGRIVAIHAPAHQGVPRPQGI